MSVETKNNLLVTNSLLATNSIEQPNNLLVGTTTQLVTPTFSLLNGATHAVQTVTIAADSNATATYYTTDGSTPTTGSTLYTVPFTISSAETVKAFSHGTGAYTDSAVGAVIYTKQATPTFSPVAGAYSSIQTVTIISAGATEIYYTTDGSDPAPGNETLYTAPITVSASKTVKARAALSGEITSAIGSAAYTISLGPAFVAATPVATGTEFGTAPVTTGAIDTRTANFIIIAVSSFDSVQANITVSDSKMNTWLPAGFKNTWGAQGGSQIYYCFNPTVDAAHTFTVTGAVDGSDSIAAIAFSGVVSGAPEAPGAGNFNGSNSSPFAACTSAQSPASVGDIMICSIGQGFNTPPIVMSIDSSYTITDQACTGAYVALFLAYKFAVAGDVSGGTQPNITVTTGTTYAAVSLVGIFSK